MKIKQPISNSEFVFFTICPCSLPCVGTIFSIEVSEEWELKWQYLDIFSHFLRDSCFTILFNFPTCRPCQSEIKWDSRIMCKFLCFLWSIVLTAGSGGNAYTVLTSNTSTGLEIMYMSRVPCMSLTWFDYWYHIWPHEYCQESLHEYRVMNSTWALWVWYSCPSHPN